MVMLFSSVNGLSQEQDYFYIAEDSLKVLSLAITEPLDDGQRLGRNTMFKDYFKEVLSQDAQLSWPFDSLKAVQTLKAPDGSFRIITWYVPLQNGQFRYFGFVQTNESNSLAGNLFELNDNSFQIQQPGFHSSVPDNWFGAWYYQLIHNRYEGDDYYALLGWRGSSPLTRQRIIEPFMISANGPVFGEAVFEAADLSLRRIIFEYSSRVAMSLKYEQHRPKAGQMPRWMIVFDRLSPTHESLRGHFQYYMPEVNVFDAFIFEEGRWKFIRDVDARSASK